MHLFVIVQTTHLDVRITFHLDARGLFIYQICLFNFIYIHEKYHLGAVIHELESYMAFLSFKKNLHIFVHKHYKKICFSLNIWIFSYRWSTWFIGFISITPITYTHRPEISNLYPWDKKEYPLFQLTNDTNTKYSYQGYNIAKLPLWNKIPEYIYIIYHFISKRVLWMMVK